MLLYHLTTPVSIRHFDVPINPSITIDAVERVLAGLGHLLLHPQRPKVWSLLWSSSDSGWSRTCWDGFFPRTIFQETRRNEMP